MHCPRTGKRNSDWELHLNMDSPTEKSSGRIKRGERKSLVSGCPLRFRSSPFSRAAFAPYSSSRQQKKGRDHKLELSSNYVNFFDRLSSFIAFSRLFSCIFLVFRIFLLNENREIFTSFSWKVASSLCQNLAFCSFSLRITRSLITKIHNQSTFFEPYSLFWVSLFHNLRTTIGRGSKNIE